MINTELFKSRLVNELSSVTIELEELGIHNPQVKEDWIAVPGEADVSTADENEHADLAEDLEERTAELDELETRYNAIVRALKKIDAGTYGICEVNGEEIELDRLDANPAARTCKAHMNNESELPNS